MHPCSIQPATPTPTAPATATPTPTLIPATNGDLDGDGDRDSNDLTLLVAELFDGDGKLAADAGGGAVSTSASPDINRDGLVTAADTAALVGM